VQELIPLDNKGGELKLTVAYYYLPSGRLVHKTKDATDWGVQPQIAVEMSPEQERSARMARYQQELLRNPVTKSTTRSATAPATTQATDVQLQRAIDTMVALVVLVGDREAGDVLPKVVMPSLPVPTTQPAATTQTRPTSEPATSEPAATEPASAPSSKPIEKQLLPEPGSDQGELDKLKDDKKLDFPPDIVPHTPTPR
jgi:hypothetical protein